MKKRMIITAVWVLMLTPLLFSIEKEEVLERMLEGYWSYGLQGDETMVTFHPIEYTEKPCLLWNHLVRVSKENPRSVDYTRRIFYIEDEREFLAYPFFAESGIMEYDVDIEEAPNGETNIDLGGIDFWVWMDEITLWDFEAEDEGDSYEEVRPFDPSGYDLIVSLGNQFYHYESWHKTGVYFIKYKGRCELEGKNLIPDPEGRFHYFESDGFYEGDSFQILYNEAWEEKDKARIHVRCNFGEESPYHGEKFGATRYEEVPPSVEEEMQRQN